MAYSDKVVEHYNNPRNVGSLPKEDPNVGTGLVGAPECGDVMKLQMNINPDTQVIEEAKFKTFGCGSAIASSSLATEWVKGKTVDEALAIKNTDIVRELSLPPVKIHCSVLAEDAIKAAPSATGRRRRGVEDADRRRARLSGQAAVGGSEGPCAGGSAGGQNMIHVTEKAAKKIQELLVKEGLPGSAGGLRVGVQGGGCSGLSYAMRLDTQARDRDKVFEENGARVFVDPKSYLYLDNTTLDYEETLMRQGFVFPESAGHPQLRLRQLVHRIAGRGDKPPPRRCMGPSCGWRHFASHVFARAFQSTGHGLHGSKHGENFRDDVLELRRGRGGAELLRLLREDSAAAARRRLFRASWACRAKLVIDPEELERRFHQLSWKLHPDNFMRASEREREMALARSSQLNDAYRALRDPVSRVEYLLSSAGMRREGQHKQQAPPELLEEVFELNESLDQLREARQAGGDPAEMAERCGRRCKRSGGAISRKNWAKWTANSKACLASGISARMPARTRPRAAETDGAHERGAQSPVVHSQSGGERAKRIGGGLSGAWDARWASISALLIA